jgi:two-component system CheB/CheR fusion protein
VGIEPGFLPRIFNRFAQEDRTSTRSYGGLGLGLAIVRHLVELHGGTVGAESPGKGQGAILSVTLPLMTETAADADDRLTPNRMAAGDGSVAGRDRIRDVQILIVDDDAATREAIAEMLHQRGARVAMAGTAEEAMTSVATLRPEVLVCDIAMPGEDGYGFLRRLRALGADRGGDTPALALTALAGEDDERRALEAGFQLHLAKPVDVDRLVDAVGVLRARRPGHASV